MKKNVSTILIWLITFSANAADLEQFKSANCIPIKLSCWESHQVVCFDSDIPVSDYGELIIAMDKIRCGDDDEESEPED